MSLKFVACTLWFGGWFSLLYSLKFPAVGLVAPVAFVVLAMLDRKESKRRRGDIIP